jgi:hypothetical protein
MKMRKRAPGGGRKPGGELRDLKAVMSLRMPQDLRDQLDRARQASGRTLSQELLWRAKLSFDRDRDLSRGRALRAFCFLFSELAQVICVNMELNPDWRFDPWLFRAVKLAISKLLDRFEPGGKMKLPEFWQQFRDADMESIGYPVTRQEREEMTESPEAMADHAVQTVLSDFNNPRRARLWFKGLKDSKATKDRDSILRRVTNDMVQRYETTFYGMGQAQRDLAGRRKS